MKIEKDKMLHFVVGGVIAIVVITFTGIPFWGVLASLIAGIAKEVWDSTGRGTPDVYDIVATVIGGIAIALVFIIAPQIFLLII
jgi:hypothetical protein